MGSADSPGENGWKIKKRKHAKQNSFPCLCYILRAIGAGRCRERRYADHIFIQIYFRMHHFVVKFSKFSSPRAASGHWPPNQNPADVPCCKWSVCWLAKVYLMWRRRSHCVSDLSRLQTSQMLHQPAHRIVCISAQFHHVFPVHCSQPVDRYIAFL